MTSANRAALASLFKTIENFVSSDRGSEEIDNDIAEVQWKLDVTVDLLERGFVDLATPIRVAEADLEEIRFARLREEQRPAAILRLDELRGELESQLAKDEELRAQPPRS
jgi:hypothetical protein